MSVVNYENPYDLSQAVELLKPVKTFAKDLLFKNEQDRLTNTIFWEKMSATDGLAQFVKNSMSPARNINKPTLGGKWISLATTKEKVLFDVNEYQSIKRLSQDSEPTKSKFNKWVLKIMQSLRDRVARRQEYLCMQAMQGLITISDTEVHFTVDYEFVAGEQTFTASSATKWNGGSDSDPLEDIQTYKRSVTRKTGMKADIVLLGSNAAKAFRNNTKLMAKLNNLNYQVGTVKPLTDVLSPMYVMTDGTTFYEYDLVYTDASGNVQNMLDPDTVIITGSQIASTFNEYNYGVINRFANNETDFNIQETPRLLASIKKNDELTGGTFTLEQISLPSIKVPDGIIKYKATL